MKQLKVFLHTSRAPDVVHELMVAGFRRFSVSDVRGTLKALGPAEQGYSIEIGERVITEAKLEIICEDDEVGTVVAIIQGAAHTGQREAGWICVADILEVIPIGGG